MATRRFNPKTGRYEDVVSSKGFRLPQLSLPKFSLFQTDRQIKDLAQSSRKAKQRSTDPAHKRVEKLKAENITRSIAEAESIARSALETGTARARAEAVKAVAKLAEVKTQAESKLERLTPTETVTVNDDEHEPLGLPAPRRADVPPLPCPRVPWIRFVAVPAPLVPHAAARQDAEYWRGYPRKRRRST